MKLISELGLELIELEDQVLLVDENKPRNYGDYYVLKDAWAEWDEDDQKWVLVDVYDNEFCLVCNSETTIVDENITGPETG